MYETCKGKSFFYVTLNYLPKLDEVMVYTVIALERPIDSALVYVKTIMY